MKLERKLKIALDENRLLMLGAQVIFGFQFNGIFQELFEQLPASQRLMACAGLILLILAIACLITPSMEHRIVERGQDNPRVLMLATLFTGCALLPFSLALAFDLFIAMQQIASPPVAAIAGGSFFALAVFFLYLLEFLVQEKKLPRVQAEPRHSTPLEYQVEQLLTEARLIMPGAQALLGFQLTVTLTRAFAQLPAEAKVVHAAALCCIGLAILLLMSPASLHRIAFAGENSLNFLRLGSAFLIAAPLPLACGIALDTYVAAGRALESQSAAAVLAITTIVVLLGGLVRLSRRAAHDAGAVMLQAEVAASERRELAAQALAAARRCKLSIVTAESCTAGKLAAALSEAPGAADHFHGGFVTYTKLMKANLLGVPETLLQRRGAVCAEVALAMAEGALARSPAALAIAITGVAGPEPDEDGNPVGFVCIAVAGTDRQAVCTEKPYGAIGRERILERAMADALQELVALTEADRTA